MKLRHNFPPFLSHIPPCCLICLYLSPWLSLSLSPTRAPSLLFSHFLLTSPPLLDEFSSIALYFLFSASTQILICFSLPSHLSLFFHDSASHSFSLPFLTFSYFICRQEVTEIKGRRRWNEAKLTPTHISSLHFLFFPTLAAKSKSVFLYTSPRHTHSVSHSFLSSFSYTFHPAFSLVLSFSCCTTSLFSLFSPCFTLLLSENMSLQLKSVQGIAQNTLQHTRNMQNITSSLWKIH